MEIKNENCRGTCEAWEDYYTWLPHTIGLGGCREELFDLSCLKKKKKLFLFMPLLSNLPFEVAFSSSKAFQFPCHTWRPGEPQPHNYHQGSKTLYILFHLQAVAIHKHCPGRSEYFIHFTEIKMILTKETKTDRSSSHSC